MALPSISVTTLPYSGGIPNDDHGVHRRVFIGPMPEKVVSHTEAQALKQKKRGLFRLNTAQEEDDMEIIKDNAFKFFVHTGGRPEDWGEDQEQTVTQEMLHRWRNSEWGAVWGSRRKKDSRIGPTSYWVGGSFEIGRFLGMDVLPETESTRNRTSSQSTREASALEFPSHTEREPRPSTTTQETFVSAHSKFLPSASNEGIAEPGPSSTARETSASASSDFLPSSHLDTNGGTSFIDYAVSAEGSIPDTSSMALLRPSLVRVRPSGTNDARAKTEVIPRPIIGGLPFSALTNGQVQENPKDKGRLVHYADVPRQGPSSPASPSEVLERTNDAVEGTSAGAASSRSLSPKVDFLDWGDVVMRGNVVDFSFPCLDIDSEERQDAYTALLY